MSHYITEDGAFGRVASLYATPDERARQGCTFCRVEQNARYNQGHASDRINPARCPRHNEETK